MSTGKIQLAIIVGLSSCLVAEAAGDGKIVTNSFGAQWQITSETYSNAPYHLMPANAPYRLVPLKNGQWVWTTNTGTYAMLDDNVTDQEIDYAKEQAVKRQFQKEQRKKWLESLPPGTANVWEYRGRWSTNVAENWGWGVWAEDTNTGWRVNLCPINTNRIAEGVFVKVGSTAANSGAGLLPSPDGKYAKLELLDANGKAVPTKRGAALNLYQMQYIEQGPLINDHPPSSGDATVERIYPDTISDLEYARSNTESPSRKKGMFIWFAGFASNGPPCRIGLIRFNDIFSIKSESDYTLTVQPVLYRMRYEGGTFQGYLDRVDLPSVSTKVHLVPK